MVRHTLHFPIGPVRNGPWRCLPGLPRGIGTHRTVDEVQGKVKEVAGKATDNERLESEGRTDQAKGKAKEAVDDAKDAVKGVRDSLTDDDAAERR